MTAYYNEHDPFAAAWLRELIAEGHIAAGDVDERSIADVQPRDLAGYRQCHFFAGIGGWSYAARLAGIPDDAPLWTGSCPCQPFSAAGKRRGTADERHLWPEFCRLIAECCPPVVAGEQVASADGRTWLAGVRTDLEALGYAVGAADLCAASIGAPHIRQRLFWVADARYRNEFDGQQLAGAACRMQGEAREQWIRVDAGHGGDASRLADAHGGQPRNGDLQSSGQYGQQPEDCCLVGLGDASGEGLALRSLAADGRGTVWDEGPASAANGPGFWDAAERIHCTDGKARRAPSAQPSFLFMADGFWYRVADVRAEYSAQAMREIAGYAKASGSRPREILSLVQKAIQQAAFWEQVAGSRSVPPPEILLHFLWDISSTFCRAPHNSSGAQESPEENGRMLRDLRVLVEAFCASLRRKSKEQFGGEPSDSLLALSWFLARCSEACWPAASGPDAAAFPLIEGAKARVGLLRGAGNAIVPQVAAEFLMAWMEAS